jgi:hypothetical protein
MGIGDEIMASGHALAEHKRTGKRVKILDVAGRPRFDVMWHGLPWIAQPHERGDFATVKNGPQCRPYISYPFGRDIGQRWTDWRARDHMGAIALTPAEQRFAKVETTGLGRGGRFFVIEPGIEAKSNPNKQWGAVNWAELAGLMIADGLTVVQLGPAARPDWSDGIRQIRTRSFRMAAAVLARAAGAVLPEGGLHHAAAVLGVPAVVLFGGHISPEVTGYDGHVNIADRGPGSPCGRWMPCRHCRDVWQGLAPADVYAALRGLVCDARAAE